MGLYIIWQVKITIWQKAICEGIYEFDKDIILLGLSGSELIKSSQGY